MPHHLDNMKTIHQHTKAVLLLLATGLMLFSCVNDWPDKTKKGPRHYNGIDVSHHQGKIDWEKVAQDTCVKFVYIKASQGASFLDSRYKRNIKGAQKHGLQCGSYHFFTMSAKAEDQFENFKKATKGCTQDLIPVVDEELHVNSNGRHRVVLTLGNLLKLFEAEYGCKPIIYCSHSSYLQIIKGDFDDYPIFIASYKSKAHIDDYHLWQFSEKGHIDGIKGYVDLDRFHKGVTLRDIELR